VPDVRLLQRAAVSADLNEPYDMKLLKKQITEGLDRTKMREREDALVMEAGRGDTSRKSMIGCSRIGGGAQIVSGGVESKYRIDFFLPRAREDLMESKFIAAEAGGQ